MSTCCCGPDGTVGTTATGHRVGATHRCGCTSGPKAGGLVVPVVVELDAVSGAVHVADDCPAVVLGQAQMKGARLLAYLVEQRERAGRARLPRLVTAHERWERRQR